jgi:Cupin domain
VAKTSKATASETAELPGFEGHYENLEGGYTVGFEAYSEDADLAPLFKGLPDDGCQSPHWGYVLKGRVAYNIGGRDEVIDAGEAYYIPPGHTPRIYAGTELIEFSPTEEFGKTVEVVMKNLESSIARGAGAVGAEAIGR